jgi:hypothetical protein
MALSPNFESTFPVTAHDTHVALADKLRSTHWRDSPKCLRVTLARVLANLTPSELEAIDAQVALLRDDATPSSACDDEDEPRY